MVSLLPFRGGEGPGMRGLALGLLVNRDRLAALGWSDSRPTKLC